MANEPTDKPPTPETVGVGSKELLGAWWEIPHPGTGQKQRCSTFEECMDKWWEGYNIPVLVVDGKREDFAAAIARVDKYYAAPNG